MTTQPSTGPRPRTDVLTALTISESAALLVKDVCYCGGQEDRRVWRKPGDLRNKHRPDCLGAVALSRLVAIEAEARAAALTAVEEAVRANRHPADVALRWRSAQHWNAALDRVLAVLAKLQEDEQVSGTTPRPWRASIGQVGVGALAAERPGLLLATAHADGHRDVAFAATHADMALIVEAVNAYDRLKRIEAAARNLSDRRTLDSDGFWVSQKEMKALDRALHPADKEAETSHE